MTRHATLAGAVATIAWLTGVGGVVATLVLLYSTDPAYRPDIDPMLFLFLAIPVTFTTVGAAIARRRPDHYAGWTLLGAGLLYSLTLVGTAYAYAGLAPTSSLPGADLAFWLSGALIVPALALPLSIFLLGFPDGHLAGRRWRAALALAVASAIVYAVAELIQPGDIADELPGIASPIAVPAELGPLVELIGSIGNIGMAVAALIAGLSVAVRYRRSGERERAQIKWIAWLAVPMGLAFVAAVLQTGPISDLAWIVGIVLLAALPVVVAIAILRYRLYDIDRLINRTVVYGALTALLAGLYAASMRLFQSIFVALTGDESDAAIVLTTLVLATTLTPLKARLEVVTGRVLGESGDAGTPAPTASAPAGIIGSGVMLDEAALQARLDELAASAVRRALARDGIEISSRKTDPRT